MKALWEMIDFLIFSCIFQIIVASHTSPHNIPLLTDGRNYPDSRNLKWINNRIVNMCCLCYFKTKRHILLFEVLLICLFNFLEWLQILTFVPFSNLHKRLALLHILWCLNLLCTHFQRCIFAKHIIITKTVLGILEENTNCSTWLPECCWLNQQNWIAMRFIHRAGDATVTFS